MKHSPLKRSKVELQRTPLRRRSRKLSALYEAERIPLVETLLREHPVCQRCQKAESVDAHEPLTRARGGSIVDPDNMVALCRECHDWIHAHPKQAGDEGWLKSRWGNGSV